MKDYEIMSSCSVTGVENSVNAKLKCGYVLVGGLVADDSGFHQAVALDSDYAARTDDETFATNRQEIETFIKKGYNNDDVVALMLGRVSDENVDKNALYIRVKLFRRLLKSRAEQQNPFHPIDTGTLPL